jgi:hypothetical protein
MSVIVINDFVNQVVQLDWGSAERADINEKCNPDWPVAS